MDSPRPSRPTPRTPAALEAELRRQLKSDLADAAEANDGELSEDTLAAIIARAIAAAFAWHMDGPEHARGPRISGGSEWRSAPGPRGYSRPPSDMDNERFDPEERPRGPRPFQN